MPCSNSKTKRLQNVRTEFGIKVDLNRERSINVIVSRYIYRTTDEKRSNLKISGSESVIIRMQSVPVPKHLAVTTCGGLEVELCNS
jgi:hypothetical protein